MYDLSFLDCMISTSYMSSVIVNVIEDWPRSFHAASDGHSDNDDDDDYDEGGGHPEDDADQVLVVLHASRLLAVLRGLN